VAEPQRCAARTEAVVAKPQEKNDHMNILIRLCRDCFCTCGKAAQNCIFAALPQNKKQNKDAFRYNSIDKRDKKSRNFSPLDL
jgi:hypothetical protein